MKSRRIVVMGDVMLDRYLIGDTHRLSPEAPVPVITVRETKSALGGAANVAANVAAIGASCKPGRVPWVTTAMPRESGPSWRPPGSTIGTWSPISGRPTTTKTRVLARNQQVVRIDEEVETPAAGPGPGAVDFGRAVRAGRDPMRWCSRITTRAR